MLNFYSRLHRKALPLESKAWLSSTISKPVPKGVDRSSTDKKEGSNANEESLAQPADNFEWRTWIGESNPISFVKAPVKGEKIYIPDIRMFVPNNQKKTLVEKPARATEHDDQVMRDSSVPSEFGCKVSHAEKSEEQRKALEIEEQRRYDAKRNKYLSEEESRVSVRKEYLREPPNREGNKCYVKFLCPSLVTEAMHDSGEMWVNEICDNSGASIKISPKGHFYPTTTDRVISVSGDYEEVKSAVNILVKDLIKVSENTDSFISHHLRV